MGHEADRARVVQIARTWLGTPYHHAAHIRGAGVDCATLIYEVFLEAGLIDAFAIEHYPHDWHLHQGQERYLEAVTSRAIEIPGPPGPGDVALWKFGRVFSHGAIVMEWPHIIHAFVGRACTIENAETAAWMRRIFELPEHKGEPRPRRFFTMWPPE